jgi:polysaccharide export outer membrane protein
MTMLRVTTLILAMLGAQALAQAPEVTNYVIGPDDLLTVTVFNEAQLSGRFRVENDGQFSYPFLGRVKAGGITAADVAAQLKARLADGYLRNPQVTVEVEQFRSQSVFVQGEVRNPGKYVLSGSVTLLEALAQAGSTTAQAGSDILILHPRTGGVGGPSDPTQADAEIQRVNLRDIENGRLSRNVTIRDGDTIIVQKAERFFVVGMVRNPGSYVLEPGTTVLQAVSMAGGVTERGSSRRIRVTRVVDGARKELDAKPGDAVLPGDTITVRQRLL